MLGYILLSIIFLYFSFILLSFFLKIYYECLVKNNPSYNDISILCSWPIGLLIILIINFHRILTKIFLKLINYTLSNLPK
jgi:hypothetical protein